MAIIHQIDNARNVDNAGILVNAPRGAGSTSVTNKNYQIDYQQTVTTGALNANLETRYTGCDICIG